MRVITDEEKSQIIRRKGRAYSSKYQPFRDMKVGENILVTREEFKAFGVDYPLSSVLNSIQRYSKPLDIKFSQYVLADKSGWVVTRIK